ncbi:hypothetical protein MPER_16120, partial [Moniliophthora perniciosa FA553]
DLNTYLQEIGNHITAEKVVLYLSRPEVMEKHGIEKKISVRTARRYLRYLGFRFMAPKKGQYADGHEREDVVAYREKKWLPFWNGIVDRIQKWTAENLPEATLITGVRIIIWFHDESIFYAHDRRRKNWYRVDADAKPYAKGDGHSLMVADF